MPSAAASSHATLTHAPPSPILNRVNAPMAPVPATATAESPNWHLGHLDALRGLAVLGVLVVHATEGCTLSPLLLEMARNGQRGVQLFFLVSAFTLFLSADNRRRAELHPTRNFFLRRVFRLTPMYYAVTALTAWLLPRLFGGWHDALPGLFFLQGFSPTAILHVAPGAWTLTDEALFYLCLPLLFRLIRSLHQALLALVLIAPTVTLLSLACARRWPLHYQYFSFLWFPIELPVFLLGIAVYFFWKQHLVASSLLAATSPSRAKLVSLLCLLGFAALFVFNIPGNNRKLYPSTIGWALLFVAVLLYPWPWLVNRATIFLGKISFSVYLLHAFFLAPLESHTARLTFFHAHPSLRFLIQFVLMLALSTAAATLTWLSVEETGIRLGRRLIAHLEHRSTRRRNIALPAPATDLLKETNTPDAQF